MSNKRVKEVSNIDRLSALPDSIITRILSFLNVDESAITAVLSRRWQFLWTQSPQLIFRQGNLMEVTDFVARVNRTLVTRGPVHLEHFWVEFEFTKPFASEVNAWVQFVVSNQVKRVAFLLNTLGNNISDFYVLPMSLCSNSFLERLGLKGCTITPQRTIDWPSLTYLYIDRMEVQQQLIPKILSGCPLLSELILNECWGFSSLEIKSKSLVDLLIRDRDHEGIYNGPMLEISAPFLKSLEVNLSCRARRKLRLTNIPSDVSAFIEFIELYVVSVKEMNNAKELLGNINHIKEVDLGANFVEVLSCMAHKYGAYQLPRSTSRTSLTVNTDTDELANIHGIVSLLESSPNLQQLVIQGKDNGMERYKFSFASANGDQLSYLLQLKTVIIKDFVAPNLAGEPMLTLVRILLKRTPVLEKIVIHVKEITKSSSALDAFTILETLLGYPRSSQKASILLR